MKSLNEVQLSTLFIRKLLFAAEIAFSVFQAVYKWNYSGFKLLKTLMLSHARHPEPFEYQHILDFGISYLKPSRVNQG